MFTSSQDTGGPESTPQDGREVVSMKIDQSWLDLIRILSPFASTLLTAIIAALAIVYNRKSTKESLGIQLH